MSQDNLTNKNTILGLSKNKLSVKKYSSDIINKAITRSQNKGTVVIVTKSKATSSQIDSPVQTDNFNAEEKKNRSRALKNASLAKDKNFEEKNPDIALPASHQVSTKPEVKKPFTTEPVSRLNDKTSKAPFKKKDGDHEEEVAKKKKTNVTKRDSKKVTLAQLDKIESDDVETKVTTIRHAARRSRDSRNHNYNKIFRTIDISTSLSANQLANKLSEKPRDIMKTLSNLDIESHHDMTLDPDTAELVATELGHKVNRVKEDSEITQILAQYNDNEENMADRPPVVTVMGHIDHGKTTLLDSLRLTDITAQESGGITQHIGAYQVELANKKLITFLDTPGHEAFTAMRMRGAEVTDIVIIVIAADDGIKQQTIEAINHAQAAEVPIIVAINKIDKPAADVDKAKNSLLSHNLVPEDMGGDVMVIPISAKEKKGLDNLEEAILLQAEMMELKADAKRRAQGVVLEARADKFKGVLATLLIQKGTLKIGDIVIIGSNYAKVRAMQNDKGKNIKLALPTMPIEIMGLDEVPEAGDEFVVVQNDKEAKKIVAFKKEQISKIEKDKDQPLSIEQMLAAQEQEAKILSVMVKADVHGSLEAIRSSLEKLSNDDIEVKVVNSVVGAISQSDVQLAKVTNSIIVGFNVRADQKTIKLAQEQSVQLDYYSVIYDIIDAVKARIQGLMPKESKEVVIGAVEIRQVFNLSKNGKVAGCMVTDGMVKAKFYARLLRDNVVVHDGKLATLKRFKEDVKEVKAGFECGLSFEKFHDIKEKDCLEVYEIIEEVKAVE